MPVSSPRVAEMVKLLENTFRAVNIGLVNEIALMCDKLGIDVWEVIDAAKTKPFGFMPFYPGPGLGGHCIPIDPFYLSWKAKQNGFEPRFIELAGQVNASMPHFVVDKIAEALNVREEAAERLARARRRASPTSATSTTSASRPRSTSWALLHEKGARVSYVDPFVPTLSARAWPGGYDLHSTPLDPATLAGFDCVAILTDHRTVDYKTLVAAAPLIVDTRNTIKQPHPHVFRLGAPSPAAVASGETAEVRVGATA